MGQPRVTTGKISNVGGEVIVATGAVTQTITHIHQRALSAIEEADLARSIEKKALAEGLRAYSECLQADASRSPAAPYRGLLPYRIADCETFLGRSEAITTLLATMDQGNLAILHAESGAGKTSLLQAGIAPRILIQHHLPILLRPYDISPAQALKGLFIRDLSQSPILAGAPLQEILFKMIEILGGDIDLFIMVDQFEEFFDHVSEDCRKEFISELGKCLDDASLNVHWLFAIRGDAFTKLSEFRPRIRSPFENECSLEKLKRAEAFEIITLPTTKFNISFEDGLVDMLLDDLGKDQIFPPQLQLVCLALLKSLSGGQTILTKDAYKKAGTVAGILRGHLSRVIDEYPSAERIIVRKVLEALISSAPKRILRPYRDLSNYLERYDISKQTLDAILLKLTEDRLLHRDETDSGINYELVHDYLLEEIRLDPEIRKRKQAEELLEQAFQNWFSNGVLTGKDTLDLIEPQLPNLNLDQERVWFLFYSAVQVKEGEQLVVWKQLLQPETKAKAFANWQESLFSRDSGKRQTAEKLLTPFWREFFFPVGGYLLGRRFLIKNRTKFLATVIGLIVLAAVVWSSVDPNAKWNEWRLVANYGEQCLDNADSSFRLIGSDYINGQSIAVWNGDKNTVCLTTDNGSNWFKLKVPDNAQAMRKIQIVGNFLFVSSDHMLVYTSLIDKSSLWKNVDLPFGVSTGNSFVIHPTNPAELWMSTSDGILYHTTNQGGSWEETAKISTTNSVTALGTDGTSIVIAAGKDLWLQKKNSGMFFTVKTALPLVGNIETIEPYSPNVYYVLVDQQGVFVLNVDEMPMSQGEDWRNLDVNAISASSSNVLIINRLGLQCLKNVIPFKFFGFVRWAFPMTIHCP